MKDDRVGRIVKQVRVHAGWRQVDLGDRAGVSQRLIAEIELGRLDHITVGRLREVTAALDVSLEIDLWWRRGDIDRLLDRAHAALVEFVVGTMRANGWTVLTEATFNRYGDRGSVDVVGWHPASQTLVLIEVKSRIGDVQELQGTFAKKVRVAPRELERERGWRPRTVVRLLVVSDSHGARSVVNAHEATFDTMWPERSTAVKRFLRRPDRSPGFGGGIWFVPASALPTRASSAIAVQRVRRSRRARGECRAGGEPRTGALTAR